MRNARHAAGSEHLVRRQLQRSREGQGPRPKAASTRSAAASSRSRTSSCSSPTNLTYADAGQALALEREGRAARVLSTRSSTARRRRRASTTSTGKYWNVNEEVGTGVRARRPRVTSSPTSVHAEGQRRRAGHRHGPELGRASASRHGRRTRCLPIDGRQDVHGRACRRSTSRSCCRTTRRSASASREELARAAHGPAQGTEESGYDGATGDTGRQRRQPAARSVARLGLRRVVREVLRGPQWLRVGRRRSTRT